MATEGLLATWATRGALDFSLLGWLALWRLWARRDQIIVTSGSGIWIFENWSCCVHISRAANPRERICEFRVAVATESTTGETGPPWGCCRRSSSSSSWTALSATGFLFQFLTLPISRTILWSWRTGSLLRAMKQGAVSVRITARGLSNGCMLIHRLIRASRSVSGAC